MSVYSVVIKLGIEIAVLWLLTILVRRLLSKRRVGGFTCFVIALALLFALKAAVFWLGHWAYTLEMVNLHG